MTNSVRSSGVNFGMNGMVAIWRSQVNGQHQEDKDGYMTIVADRCVRLSAWASTHPNMTDYKPLFASLQDSQVTPPQRIERAVKLLRISMPMMIQEVADTACTRKLLLDQSRDDLLVAFDRLYGFEGVVQWATLQATLDSRIRVNHSLFCQ